MAMIKCPECGKKISDKAEACPNCGCPIDKNSLNNIDNQKKPKKNNALKILITVVVVLLYSEAYSDNYEEEIAPYQFDITVNN